MSIFVDQLNRKVILDQKPSRIISLVPSQTELLYDLGLGAEVVGITKFCVHPENWYRTKARIGGTKKINFESIAELKPDLIIGNKEENEQEQIEYLMKVYTVWMSDIQNLYQAFDMITRLGAVTEKENEAGFLKIETEYLFNKLASENILLNKTCAYFIWNKPYMVAGANTFINDMLKRCGLINVFQREPFLRYPEIDATVLEKLSPQVILLSSEPYPFKEKHVSELKEICPEAKVMIVDGELFSWYGSRLKHAPAYFQEIISQLV